jgi:hypothetical protein
MKHELARELKIAGFPQTSDWGYRTYENGDVSMVNYHRNASFEEDVRIPTLEQLIEVWSLIQPTFQLIRMGDTGWSANGFEGATPTEAVARSLLALYGDAAANA